jgi:hypothetical protein
MLNNRPEWVQSSKLNILRAAFLLAASCVDGWAGRPAEGRRYESVMHFTPSEGVRGGDSGADCHRNAAGRGLQGERPNTI